MEMIGNKTLDGLDCPVSDSIYVFVIKSSKTERSILFHSQFFLCEFDFVRWPNSIELNLSIKFD